MTRASIVPLAFLIAAACDRAPTIPNADVLTTADVAGEAAATGPSASGAGTIEFGASKEHVSFHSSGVLLAATGSAEIHDNTVAGNVNAHDDINCLNVMGNQATISGIITQTNDPTIQGFQALWQVRDNGEGKKDAPDMMSPVLIFAVGVGPDCTVPSEFDLVNLKGNVRVVP